MYNTRRSFSCTLAAIFPNLGSQSANLLPSFPLWNIQIRLPTSVERYSEWPADLNQLTDDDLTARTGLVQIVHQPTRGTNILYRIFVSNPQLYSSVRVVASVVRATTKLSYSLRSLMSDIVYSRRQKWNALTGPNHHLSTPRSWTTQPMSTLTILILRPVLTRLSTPRLNSTTSTT